MELILALLYPVQEESISFGPQGPVYIRFRVAWYMFAWMTDSVINTSAPVQ